MKYLFYFISLFLIFFNSKSLNCQINSNFVEVNKRQLDKSEDLISYDYKLYVIGESHGFESNYNIALFFLKTLYKNANVRIFFVEFPYAHGMALNKYLEDGIFDENDCLFSYFDKNSEKLFLKEIKSFYDSLPNEDKFTFIGIDYISYFRIDCTFSKIFKILDKSNPPESISKTILWFRLKYKNVSNSRERMWKDADSLVSNFFNNQQSYIEYLGKDYYDYESMVYDLKESVSLHGNNFNRPIKVPESIYKKRENLMYQNIIRGISKNPNCNYLSLNGANHTYLSKTKFYNYFHTKYVEHETLVTMLNNKINSPLLNNVCVFNIVYNSHKIINNPYKKEIGKKNYEELKKMLKKNEITLIKLNEVNSYFKKISNEKYDYIIWVNN